MSFHTSDGDIWMSVKLEPPCKGGCHLSTLELSARVNLVCRVKPVYNHTHLYGPEASSSPYIQDPLRILRNGGQIWFSSQRDLNQLVHNVEPITLFLKT